MAKQTFTTGQVLTAAQMTSLQQTAMGGGSTTAKTTSYVLVAADAGTVVQMNSASATTITVNTALFAAGDTVQIQNVGSGVCTVTAGTATVSTAGSLALSQYEGGQLYFNTTSAALFFDIVQSSGMTNPMTTTGDIIYSSSGSTPARLGIGTTGQVLNVAGGIPAWATPATATSGLTLIKRASFSSVATTSTTFDSVFTSTYRSFMVVIEQISAATEGDDLHCLYRYSATSQSSVYFSASLQLPASGATVNTQVSNGAQITIAADTGGAAYPSGATMYFSNIGNGSSKPFLYGQMAAAAGSPSIYNFSGYQDTARSYDGFLLKSSSTNITGTVSVYGLAIA